MASGVKDTTFARLQGAAGSITLSQADITRHRQLSDVEGLLRILVLAKLRELLGADFGKLDQRRLDYLVKNLIQQGMSAAEAQNRSGATPEGAGPYFLIGTITLTDLDQVRLSGETLATKKELTLSFTARDLAHVTPTEAATLTPKDQIKDVVRDRFIDEQFEKMRAELGQTTFDAVEGAAFFKSLDKITDPEERERYRLLVLDRLRSKKEDVLRKYFEARKLSFENIATRGVLEARAAAIDEALAATPTEKTVALLTDEILKVLIEAGIFTDADLKEDGSPAPSLGRKLQLILSLSDFSLVPRSDEELRALREKLQVTYQSLTGAERDGYLKMLRLGLIGVPQQVAAASEVLAKIQVGPKEVTITQIEVRAKAAKIREGELADYKEAVRSVSLMLQMQAEATPGTYLSEDPTRARTELAGQFQKAGRDFKAWWKNAETKAENLALGDIKTLRATVGDETTKAVLEKFQDESQLYLSALASTVRPYLEEAWLLLPSVGLKMPSDTELRDLMKTRGLATLEDARDLVFKEAVAARGFSAENKEKDVDTQIGVWFQEQLDRILTQTLIPGIVSEVDKDERYGALRRQLEEAKFLGKGHAAFEFAILATDLLPLIKPEIDVRYQSLQETVDQFAKAIAEIPDATTRQKVLQNLRYLRRVRDDIGKSIVPKFREELAYRNPFALYTQTGLQEVELGQILYSLNRPTSAAAGEEERAALAFWEALRKGIINLRDPLNPSAPLGVADAPSLIRLSVSPQGAVQVEFKRRVTDETLKTLCTDKGDAEFWKHLADPFFAETTPERAQARQQVLALLSDRENLAFSSAQKSEELPALTQSLADLLRSPEAKTYFRTRVRDRVHREILNAVGESSIPNFTDLLNRASVALGLTLQTEKDSFKAEIRGLYAIDESAGKLSQQGGQLFGVLYDFLRRRIWHNPAPKAPETNDLKTLFADCPFPERLYEVLDQNSRPFADSLQAALKEASTKAKKDVPWEAYRKDLKEYLRDQNQAIAGYMQARQKQYYMGEMEMEEISFFETLGQDLAKAPSSNDDPFAALTAGFNLLRHPSGRLFIESWLRSGLYQTDLNVAALYQLALVPGTHAEVAKAIREFIGTDERAILNLAVPVKVEIGGDGKLKITASESLRIYDNFAEAALNRSDLITLDVAQSGTVSLQFKKDDASVKIDPGKDLASSTAIKITVGETVRLFGEQYLRTYWDRYYQYDAQGALIAKIPPEAMPPPQEILNTLLTDSKFFRANSQLAQTVAQKLGSDSAYLKNLQTFGEGFVQEWNYEHAPLPGPEPKKMDPNFVVVNPAKGRALFQDFVLGKQCLSGDTLTTEQYQEILKGLADDPSLAGIDLEGALKSLITLGKKPWSPEPSAAEIRLVTVLLRRLGFTITALPDLRKQNRPVVGDERFSLSQLRGEIARQLQARLGISVDRTENWPLLLAKAYQINSGFFRLSDLKGRDQIGMVPSAPGGKTIAVIQGNHFREGDDQFLHELNRAARVIGRERVTVDVNGNGTEFTQAGSESFIQEFMLRDVRNRFDAFGRTVNRLQSFTGKDLGAFLDQAASHGEKEEAYWGKALTDAQASFVRQSKPMPLGEAEMLVGYLLDETAAGRPAPLQEGLALLQEGAGLYDQIKRPEQNTFLIAQIDEAVRALPISAALADNLRAKAVSAKGDVQIFWNTLRDDGQTKSYARLILAHLFLSERAKTQNELAEFRPQKLAQTIAGADEGLLDDLQKSGALKSLFEGLPSESRALFTKWFDSNALATPVNAKRLIELLRTPADAKELAQLLALLAARIEASPALFGAESVNAWAYLRLTARLRDKSAYVPFDNYRDLFRQGDLSYCYFNNDWVAKKAKIPREMVRLYLSQREEVRIALPNRKEAQTTFEGEFINLPFFGSYGAQRMLASAVLATPQLNQGIDPIASLTQYMEEHFKDGVPIETLVTYNRPSLDALPDLPISEEYSQPLQKDLLRKATKDVASVALALQRTAPDLAQPTAAEISKATDLVNQVLTGRRMILFNYEGSRSGKPTEGKIVNPKVMCVARNPSGDKMESLTEDEAALIFRVFQGLLLNQRAYDPQHDFVTSGEPGYGYALIQYWNDLAREETGVDTQGRAAESVAGAAIQLKSAGIIDENDQATLLRFANQKAIQAISSLLSLDQKNTGWAHAKELPDHVLDQLISDSLMPGGNDASQDALSVRAMAQKNPEQVKQALWGATKIFGHELLTTIQRSGLMPLGTMPERSRDMVNIAYNQSEETGKLLSHYLQGDWRNWQGRDYFSLDKDLLRSLLEGNERTYDDYALKEILAKEPELEGLSDKERMQALAAAALVANEANNTPVPPEMILNNLLEDPKAVADLLANMDVSLWRQGVASRKEIVLNPALENLLERRFVARAIPALGKTAKVQARTVYVPLQIDGRKYRPSPLGGKTEVFTYPGDIKALINSMPVLGLSFYEENPCGDLYRKAPLGTIKLFLYTHMATEGAKNENPVRVDSNGKAYLDNSQFNAGDIRALIKVFNASRWSFDKTQASPEDINALERYARALEPKSGAEGEWPFRQAPPITDIYLAPDKLDAALDAFARAEGIDPTSAKFQEYKALHQQVLRVLKNFHQGLGTLLLTDMMMMDPRADQKQWIAGMREARKRGAKDVGTVAWENVKGTAGTVGDMAYNLFSLTSLPDMAASNSVVDTRILQLKELLYGLNPEQFATPAERQAALEKIKREDPKLYAFLHDTSINADFLERLLNNEKLSGRLDASFLTQCVNWVFKTEQKDARILRIIHQYGTAEKLLRHVLDVLRDKEKQYPGQTFPWRSLNVNLTGDEEDDQVAKLVLQGAIGKAMITEGDADEFNLLTRAADIVGAPSSTLEYMFFAKMEYAKTIKGYMLQKKGQGFKQGMDSGGAGWDSGLTLFDNKVDHQVIEWGAREFERYLSSYENNPADLIRVIDTQGYDWPGQLDSMIDPAGTPERVKENFAHLKSLVEALKKAAADKTISIDMNEVGYGEHKDAEKALRILATVVIPQQSMGQEQSFNIGAAIYQCVGDQALTSMEVVSSLAAGGDSGISFSRDRSLAPADPYWGDSGGERLAHRLGHTSVEIGQEFLYFRYVMHIQIALEMQAAILKKTAQISYAYSCGDPMAAHRLKEELKHFLKSRINFIAFEKNPLAWVYGSVERILDGEWDEKAAAALKLIAFDLPYAKSTVGVSFRGARDVGAWAGNFFMGGEYRLAGIDTQGVDWYKVHDEIHPPDASLSRAEQFEAATLSRNEQLARRARMTKGAFQRHPVTTLPGAVILHPAEVLDPVLGPVSESLRNLGRTILSPFRPAIRYLQGHSIGDLPLVGRIPGIRNARTTINLNSIPDTIKPAEYFRDPWASHVQHWEHVRGPIAQWVTRQVSRFLPALPRMGLVTYLRTALQNGRWYADYMDLGHEQQTQGSVENRPEETTKPLREQQVRGSKLEREAIRIDELDAKIKEIETPFQDPDRAPGTLRTDTPDAVRVEHQRLVAESNRQKAEFKARQQRVDQYLQARTEQVRARHGETLAPFLEMPQIAQSPEMLRFQMGSALQEDFTKGLPSQSLYEMSAAAEQAKSEIPRLQQEIAGGNADPNLSQQLTQHQMNVQTIYEILHDIDPAHPPTFEQMLDELTRADGIVAQEAKIFEAAAQVHERFEAIQKELGELQEKYGLTADEKGLSNKAPKPKRKQFGRLQRELAELETRFQEASTALGELRAGPFHEDIAVIGARTYTPPDPAPLLQQMLQQAQGNLAKLQELRNAALRADAPAELRAKLPDFEKDIAECEQTIKGIKEGTRARPRGWQRLLNNPLSNNRFTRWAANLALAPFNMHTAAVLANPGDQIRIADEFKAAWAIHGPDLLLDTEIKAIVDGKPELQKALKRIKGAPYGSENPFWDPKKIELLSTDEIRAALKGTLKGPNALQAVEEVVTALETKTAMGKIIPEVLYHIAENTTRATPWELSLRDSTYFNHLDPEVNSTLIDRERGTVKLQLTRENFDELLKITEDQFSNRALRHDAGNIIRKLRGEKVIWGLEASGQARVEGAYHALANQLIIQCPELENLVVKDGNPNRKSELTQQIAQWLQVIGGSLHAEIKSSLYGQMILQNRTLAVTKAARNLFKASGGTRNALHSIDATLWDLYDIKPTAGHATLSDGTVISVEDLAAFRAKATSIVNRMRATEHMKAGAGLIGFALGGAAFAEIYEQIATGKGASWSGFAHKAKGEVGKAAGFFGVEAGMKPVMGRVGFLRPSDAKVAKLAPKLGMTAERTSYTLGARWAGPLAWGFTEGAFSAYDEFEKGNLTGEGSAIHARAWTNVGTATVIGVAGGTVFMMATGGTIVAVTGGVALVIGVVIGGVLYLANKGAQAFLNWLWEHNGWDLNVDKDIFDYRSKDQWMQHEIPEDRMRLLQNDLLLKAFPGGIYIGSEPIVQPSDKGEFVTVRKDFLWKLVHEKDFYDKLVGHLGLDQFFFSEGSQASEETFRAMGDFVRQFREEKQTDLPIAMDASACLSQLSSVTGMSSDDPEMWETFADVQDLQAQLKNDPVQNLIDNAREGGGSIDGATVGRTLYEDAVAKVDLLKKLDGLYVGITKDHPRWAAEAAFSRVCGWEGMRRKLESTLASLQALSPEHAKIVWKTGEREKAISWLQLNLAQAQDKLAKDLPADFDKAFDKTMASGTSASPGDSIDVTAKDSTRALFDLELVERQIEANASGLKPEERTKLSEAAIAACDRGLKSGGDAGLREHFLHAKIAHEQKLEKFNEAQGAAAELMQTALNGHDGAMYERSLDLYASLLDKAPDTRSLLCGPGYLGLDLGPIRVQPPQPIIIADRMRSNGTGVLAAGLFLGPQPADSMRYPWGASDFTSDLLQPIGSRYAVPFGQANGNGASSFDPTPLVLRDLGEKLKNLIYVWQSCGADRPDELRALLAAAWQQIYASDDSVPAPIRKILEERKQSLAAALNLAGLRDPQGKINLATLIPSGQPGNAARDVVLRNPTRAGADSVTLDLDRAGASFQDIDQLVRLILLFEQEVQGHGDASIFPTTQTNPLVERSFETAGSSHITMRIKDAPEDLVKADLEKVYARPLTATDITNLAGSEKDEFRKGLLDLWVRIKNDSPIIRYVEQDLERLYDRPLTKETLEKLLTTEKDPKKLACLKMWKDLQVHNRWFDLVHEDVAVKAEEEIPDLQGTLIRRTHLVADATREKKFEEVSATTGDVDRANIKRELLTKPMDAQDPNLARLSPMALLANGLYVTVDELKASLGKMPAEAPERKMMEKFLDDRAKAPAVAVSTSSKVKVGTKELSLSEIVRPFEWYGFLSTEMKVADPAAFERQMLAQVLAVNFGPQAAGDLYKIDSRQLAAKIRTLSMGLRGDNPVACFNVDPGYVDPKSEFNPDVVLIQVALHRLGLLNPQSIDGVRNLDTAVAWHRYLEMRDLRTASLAAVLQDMTDRGYLMREPIDAESSESRETLKGIAQKIWDCADGGFMDPTLEEPWEEALLGLTKAQIAAVNRYHLQISENEYSLAESAAYEMDFKETDFPRECVDHQYQGWYDPVGQIAVPGQVVIVDTGNPATRDYVPKIGTSLPTSLATKPISAATGSRVETLLASYQQTVYGLRNPPEVECYK